VGFDQMRGVGQKGVFYLRWDSPRFDFVEGDKGDALFEATSFEKLFSDPLVLDYDVVEFASCGDLERG
jgi:hypothetical protein